MNTVLPSALYDKLKWVALVLLPALSAAYFSLSGVWGLPNAEQVVGTAAIIDTLLGALLGFSTSQYNRRPEQYDGTLEVAAENLSLIHQLEITTDPADLAGKDSIKFKVKQVPPSEAPE